MSRAARITLLTVTIVGIVVELFILRHYLVNKYPYNAMSYPPARFYALLGNVGIPVSLVLLLLCAFVMARKWPVFAPAVLTTLTPLLWLGLLAGLTYAIYGSTVPAGVGNHDGHGVDYPVTEFATVATALALVGFVVGATFGKKLRPVPAIRR